MKTPRGDNRGGKKPEWKKMGGKRLDGNTHMGAKLKWKKTGLGKSKWGKDLQRKRPGRVVGEDHCRIKGGVGIT